MIPEDGDYAEISRSYAKDRIHRLQNRAFVGVFRGLYHKARNEKCNSKN